MDRITPGQSCSVQNWHASALSRIFSPDLTRIKCCHQESWWPGSCEGWAPESWHCCQIIPVFATDRSLWRGVRPWCQTQAISFMVTPWSWTKRSRTMNLISWIKPDLMNSVVIDPHLECFARSWQIFAQLHHIGSKQSCLLLILSVMTC